MHVCEHVFLVMLKIIGGSKLLNLVVGTSDTWKLPSPDSSMATVCVCPGIDLRVFFPDVFFLS